LTYSIRHQVFVSSTFTDLIEERAEVLQAVWELDCIPTGMEAFVASNESQWTVIKRAIDECDYYVLIIGGRYGSITDDGVSYTEKEYRYAKKIGIPVLAFVHAAPADIPIGKSEVEGDKRGKLDRFRSDVMTEYPVRTWASASELGGLVSRSLVREIKVNPRPGWIRNDGSSPIALLERVSALAEENRKLQEAISSYTIEDADQTLENGEDAYRIYGERRLHSGDKGYLIRDWSTITSWDAMFRDIGPSLINETTEADLNDTLARFNGLDPLPKNTSQRGHCIVMLESFNEILIQFRALGLIDKGTKKRGVNDTNSYWKITPSGDRKLLSLLARRKIPSA
jgi:hypothetical protein